MVSFAVVTEPKDISRQSESNIRGFWSLIVTQFQGAFSDNVLKNLVVFLLVGMDMSLARKHELGELVMALFALPFILFSMAGGFLADRRSKRTMTIGVKVFEVFVMLLARDRSIMGRLASGRILGTIGWVSTAVLILLSLVLVATAFVGGA